MERWLSLTVSESRPPKTGASGPLVLISIPKKIVRQAVRRNRIKRVLKEALRQEPALTEVKTHIFKVFRAPEKVDLHIARQAVHGLLFR
jgi:ribonuclease P protein component